MSFQTLAHLSDLHLGRSPADEAAARALVETLQEAQVDQVAVTGDVTHRGRDEEMSLFFDVFAPLTRSHRLTVVPGNHDRTTDDAGQALMGGRRVAVEEKPGLCLIRIDSTAAHNRSFIASHGEVTQAMVEDVDAALQQAPKNALRVLLLHHHPLALPEETWLERWSERLRLPYCSELPLGRALLRRARGEADLVLHGHRHVPREIHLGAPGQRPLALYNAGSSTQLRRARLFSHADGLLQAPPRWLWADPSDVRDAKRLPVMVPAPARDVERAALAVTAGG
ncbi:MAG: metallophosphoesterase family protein [Myxococcaceae bacterium]